MQRGQRVFGTSTEREMNRWTYCVLGIVLKNWRLKKSNSPRPLPLEVGVTSLFCKNRS